MEGLRLLGDGARPPADEAGLPQRFAAGEPGAFETMVALYQARVERLASRLLGWRGDVDDVTQDVFLAAFRNARRCRGGGGGGGGGLWPWLAAITVNACRTHRRREWVRRACLRGRHASPDAATPADAEAQGREDLVRVRDAIGRLGVADREVLVLHHLEGMPAAGLADVLGLSVNAVQVRLHRARHRLKAELGDLSTED